MARCRRRRSWPRQHRRLRGTLGGFAAGRSSATSGNCSSTWKRRSRHSTLPLPEPSIVPYDATTGPELAAIERALAEIDLEDSNSILFFGTAAQAEVTTVADEMLEGVRSKDTGPAGRALNEMVSTLRGFSLEDLGKRKRGLLARLLGRARPIARVLQQYEAVRGHIDAISNRLDEERLPALAREAESSGDMLKAQSLRDLRAKRDDLERRVYDLKLTRQVTMQSLPSIRLVQENDKALVSKIGSTMANTIPLWRQQLAMAVTIAQSAEAGDTLKQALLAAQTRQSERV